MLLDGVGNLLEQAHDPGAPARRDVVVEHDYFLLRDSFNGRPPWPCRDGAHSLRAAFGIGQKDVPGVSRDYGFRRQLRVARVLFVGRVGDIFQTKFRQKASQERLIGNAVVRVVKLIIKRRSDGQFWCAGVHRSQVGGH